jgi:hypothetical protein
MEIPAAALHAERSKVIKNKAAALLMLVLTLAAACAPAAPTPTAAPEPQPTPVEVRATKPEHLAGIWFDGASYIRFEEDGTALAAETVENLGKCPDLCMHGRYWFEDGVYYEEPPICEGIFAYDAYLRIEDGRAVRARKTVIEVPEEPCPDLKIGTQRVLTRVD